MSDALPAYRTHTCGELRAGDVGRTVRLSGWVHRKRDHGHLLFVDLRDHYGLTQIVADTASPAFKTLDRIRVESVVTIEGEVVARSEDTVNDNLATGQIEIRAGEVTVQSAAADCTVTSAAETSISPVARLGFTVSGERATTLPSTVTTDSTRIRSSVLNAGEPVSATI